MVRAAAALGPRALAPRLMALALLLGPMLGCAAQDDASSNRVDAAALTDGAGTGDATGTRPDAPATAIDAGATSGDATGPADAPQSLDAPAARDTSGGSDLATTARDVALVEARPTDTAAVSDRPAGNADTASGAPIPARFVLHNRTGRTIYIQSSGWSGQEFFALGRAGQSLPIDNTCELCDCNQCASCAVCGRAIAQVLPIAAGSSHEFAWDGRIWVVVPNACRAGLACEQEQRVPPTPLTARLTYGESYRVDTQFGAGDELIVDPHTITVDFAYPATGVIEFVAMATPRDGGTSPTCVFDQRYEYGHIGGFRSSVGRTTLTPASSFLHVRTTVREPRTSTSCSPPLPACGAANQIGSDDVEAAMAHPDVRAALASPTPLLYGRDTRPVDGTVFELVRQDSRGLLVGFPCEGAAGCREIPPGVAALVTLLEALDRQQLALPACSALAAP